MWIFEPIKKYTVIHFTHLCNRSTPQKQQEQRDSWALCAMKQVKQLSSYLHAPQTLGCSGSVCRTSGRFCTACARNISATKDRAHFTSEVPTVCRIFREQHAGNTQKKNFAECTCCVPLSCRNKCSFLLLASKASHTDTVRGRLRHWDKWRTQLLREQPRWWRAVGEM